MHVYLAIMKKWFVLLACLFVLKTMFAQTEDSIKNLDLYYVDFAVPDVGAFTLLNTTPDHVSTPGTPKEFAMSLLNAVGNNQDITPGLAIEWAPMKTFIKKSTLDDYSKLRWLKDMQVTFGTVADSLGTKVGAGFKWTIYNEMDPLLDRSFRKEILDIDNMAFKNIAKAQKSLRDSFTMFLSTMGNRIDSNKSALLYQSEKINNLIFFDSIALKSEIKDIEKIIVNTLDESKKVDNKVLTLIVGNCFSEISKSEIDSNLYNQYHKDIDLLNVLRMDVSDYKVYMLKTVQSELRRIFGDTTSMTGAEASQLAGYCDQIKILWNDKTQYNNALIEKLEKAKNDWLNSKWNAMVVSLGVGWVSLSSDNKWATLGQHTLKAYANGQVGIGEKAKLNMLLKYEKPFYATLTDSSMIADLFGGIRFIVGNCEDRFSFDIGYNQGWAHQSGFNTNSLLFSVGYEKKITDGIFLEVVTGYKGVLSGIKNSNILALGNLKFALQPKQRFSMNGK